MSDTDRRVGEGKPVAPSFMLACMLWHDVQSRWSQLRNKGEPAFQALQQAIDNVFDARIGDISGRGKLAADMREIWMMQPRFERRVGSGVATLVEQPRFRAGFDFLRLRCDAGELDAELGQWWEAYSTADADERRELMDRVRAQEHGTKRVRSTRAKLSVADSASADASDAAESDSTDAMGDDLPAGDDPAKKRRRRRRRSGTGRSAEGAATQPSGEAGDGARTDDARADADSPEPRQN